jgi:hypothetical protein
VQHRSAPDHGRLRVVDQEPDTHQFDAVTLVRNDALAIGHRLAVHAEHGRNAGTIDVGIEQPDARAELLQAEREIGGDGALADAALAAHHEHDALHRRNGVVGGNFTVRQLEGHGAAAP